MSRRRHSFFATWGRLLRLPNLFTLPGDILAGGAWAGMALCSFAGWGALIAILLLYAAGLLLNDYFDRKVDASERPERPIPAGEVEPRAVLAAGFGLLASGILFGFLVGIRPGIATTVLAMLVVLYNIGGKKVSVLGPLLMGLCRGGAVLVGVVSFKGVIPPEVWWVPAFSISYVFCITLIAARECGQDGLGNGWLYPLFPVVAAILVVVSFETTLFTVLSLALFAAAAVGIAIKGVATSRSGGPIPPFVGFMLRSYILFQGAWVLILYPSLDWKTAVIFVSMFALFRLSAGLASRRFYGS